MPKRARELTALEVSRLSEPGRYAVGVVPGLHLQVQSPTSRAWLLRVQVGIKRRDIGLGGYPEVTLAKARDKAREARELIRTGVDPVQQAQAAQSALRAEQVGALTFAEAALQYIAAHEAGWRNAKHGQQWTSTLQTYAFPAIGKLHVRDVELSHILAILEPIWRTKTETASRVRNRIELVLDWATARGSREGLNPARWRGHLDKLLPKPEKVAKETHHPAVQISEIGSFVQRLREVAGSSARALEMLTLTAVRSRNVRAMAWNEVDLGSAVWIIPADSGRDGDGASRQRMKTGREHRVPLSPAALSLLRSLPRSAESDLVFPAPRGGMLSDMALAMTMRRMDFKDSDRRVAVPHGLRSTFRDWAGEFTNHPREVAEMALAHAIENKAEAAYRRGDLFEKRRRLMDDWAEFVTVPLPKGAALPTRRVAD